MKKAIAVLLAAGFLAGCDNEGWNKLTGSGSSEVNNSGTITYQNVQVGGQDNTGTLDQSKPLPTAKGAR